MNRITEDVRRHKAEGAVGMDIDTNVEEIEYEINDTKYRDLLAHFVAVGTAIVHKEQPNQQANSPLLLYNLAGGKPEQLKIDM